MQKLQDLLLILFLILMVVMAVDTFRRLPSEKEIENTINNVQTKEY